MRLSTLWRFLLAPVAVLLAQPTIAPTPDESVRPANGENIGDYNVSNSFELGYRFHSVGGNAGKYRSDVNFGNGVRLLGNQLRVNSREGRGRFFDELTLSTTGLGEDPYQSAIVRLEKNRFYRYDMSWRLADYYNPALAISDGLHRMDTRRIFQDHDITLFPQSNFRIFGGYTRNSQSGAGLSTIQAFDSRGDEFPLFQNINRLRNEYRLGAEGMLYGFRLNVLKGWDNFTENVPLGPPMLPSGANAQDLVTLNSFQSAAPYRGGSPYWRFLLSRNTKLYSLTGRFASVSGRRNYLTDESAIGVDRLGAARNRQVLVFGDGSRPVTSGSLNFSLFPTAKLTLSNQTGFHHTRMNGNSSVQEISNGTALAQIIDFQYLGIRTIDSLTDILYAANPKITLRGGYHMAIRRIRSIEGQSFAEFSDSVFHEQTNRTHAAIGGIRLRPWKPLMLQLDAEAGRNNRPFLPISDKNYQTFNGRVQYRGRAFSFAARARTFYNTNSVSLFSHSSRSRQYNVDASWTPSSRLALDAGYGKLHLDTRTAIAYFASSQFLSDASALYISNLHTAHLGARLVLNKRADLYAGYSLVRDAGDGRKQPVVVAAEDATASQAFSFAQTFPLSYQTPMARLSIALRQKLRWNVGYQHYAYTEDFSRPFYQNYRAHTGYTSLLWSF